MTLDSLNEIIVNPASVRMGCEFYKFKTGFTESQKVDSARADSPGILTLFS